MKIKKSIIIKIFIIMIFLIVTTLDVQALTLNQISSEAGSIIDRGSNQINAGMVDNITETLMPIGKILTTIGVGVILCVGAIMGIKWITANPEEQAKLKQQLVGLAVSAIVIFGAYTIWSLSIDIASKLS